MFDPLKHFALPLELNGMLHSYISKEVIGNVIFSRGLARDVDKFGIICLVDLIG